MYAVKEIFFKSVLVLEVVKYVKNIKPFPHHESQLAFGRMHNVSLVLRHKANVELIFICKYHNKPRVILLMNKCNFTWLHISIQKTTGSSCTTSRKLLTLDCLSILYKLSHCIIGNSNSYVIFVLHDLPCTVAFNTGRALFLQQVEGMHL